MRFHGAADGEIWMNWSKRAGQLPHEKGKSVFIPFHRLHLFALNGYFAV